MYSRLVCVSPDCPVGRLTLMPFMCTWLKLTIMKLASRKNMMSINGMISIRAFLCGIGDARFIGLEAQHATLPRGGQFGFPFCSCVCFQHHLKVRGRGLQLEL